MVINSTDAVLLARAVIRWWEESADFALCQELHQQEPAAIRQARSTLKKAQGRLRFTTLSGQQQTLLVR